MKNISYFSCAQPNVIAQMHEHALQISSFNGIELYQEPRKLVQGIIEVFEKYDFSFPVLGYDVYNIEAEAMGQQISFKKEGSPQIDRKNLLIHSKADLDKLYLKKPIIEKGRFKFVILATEEYIKRTNLFPPLQFTAPFSLAAQIYNIENLIIKMLSDAKFVHELMKRITYNILIPWIDYQQEYFLEARPILGADAMASPPNLTYSMLEEFVVPYIKILKEELGSEVGVVNWWGDSYFSDPIEFYKLKKEVSPNNKIIRIQDPDLAKLNLDKIVKFINKNNLKLTLGLGASFISLQSSKDIHERVIKYCEAGKKVKEFTLYFCNISYDTSPAKIKQAISSARECFA